MTEEITDTQKDKLVREAIRQADLTLDSDTFSEWTFEGIVQGVIDNVADDRDVYGYSGPREVAYEALDERREEIEKRVRTKRSEDTTETETTTDVISIFELAKNRDEDLEKLAKASLSAALDNGHDMHKTDPREHAQQAWKGYVENTIVRYADEYYTIHDDQLDPERQRQLVARTRAVAPLVAEEMGLTLRKERKCDE